MRVFVRRGRARGFPAGTRGLLAVLLLCAACGAASQDDVAAEARALRSEDPRAALSLLDGAIASLTPEDDPARQIELLHLRAQILRDAGRLEEAAADAERFQRLAERIDDPVQVARSLYMRATIEAERGDVPAALERFHAARRLLEGTDAHAELARVTNAIGVAHNFVDDFERARSYYEQALEMARAASEDAFATSVLGNLAVVVAELEGPEAGLAMHREALAMAEARDDIRTVGYQLANMCDRLTQLGRLEQAEETCLRAANELQALGHSRILAGTRMTLGDLRLQQARPGEALVHYEEALRAAEGEVPSVEREVLGELADLHESRGDYAKALDYYRRMIDVRESMRDEERRELVEELEVRYEVDEREKEIELLQLASELQAARLQRRNWMLFGVTAALGMAAMLALVAWRGYRVKARLERELAQRNLELEGALETISELAREDPLTGLLNRRAFLELAEHEQTHVRREGRSLVVAMADIDNFKPVNDEYGHHVGDQVLKEVATRLRRGLRRVDVVCRWGGEEFLCLLPGASVVEARQSVERARHAIANTPVETEAGRFDVTVTFGVAAVGDDLDEAIHAADQAMYEGKRAGGNRSVARGTA